MTDALPDALHGRGHNRGPTMEPGAGWRRYAWRKARAELLPQMPLEVVRRRVRRARELGIDYTVYASIRATTGRDLIAFLFSSNALLPDREGRLAGDRAARLQAVPVDRLALVHPPLDPAAVLAANAPHLIAADRAPGLADGWGETRRRVLSLLDGRPADGVLVVGATGLEREWAEAARCAGFLSAARWSGAA